MAYRRKKKNNKGFIATVSILLITIAISSQTKQLNEKGSDIANTVFFPV